MTTPENAITYHNALSLSLQNFVLALFSLCLWAFFNSTLGARDFSSVVSGFCQVYGRRGVGLRPTPKIPAAREKKLWYPGYFNSQLPRKTNKEHYGMFWYFWRYPHSPNALKRFSWAFLAGAHSPRLFAVLYFSVRSSRSSALHYGLPSCMSVKTN